MQQGKGEGKGYVLGDVLLPQQVVQGEEEPAPDLQQGAEGENGEDNCPHEPHFSALVGGERPDEGQRQEAIAQKNGVDIGKGGRTLLNLAQPLRPIAPPEGVQVGGGEPANQVSA